jgi:hypothetical protein
MNVMPITDAKAKNAKSREKQYKIQDTGGALFAHYFIRG